MSARTRRPAVGSRLQGRARLAAGPPFFRPDWPFSPADDASLFGPGRRRAFLCAQVGRVAPRAILIGAPRASPSLSRAVRADSAPRLPLPVLPPRCYEAEVKTPRQSSRTSGKQGRLRRTASRRDTRKESARRSGRTRENVHEGGHI